ncbi:MAG: TonB family protein [Hymenobacteraceae bacterium]|nr:TonB family protein [Hymenobacteraceae bacterium]
MALFVLPCLIALPLAAQPGARGLKPLASSAAVPQASEANSATTPATGSVALPAFAQPEFPGGDVALIAFLGQNLHYPADVYKEKVEGKVNVSFWIDEQGRPYGFGVVESPHPSLTAEALRAMHLMPVWTPGRRDNRIVPLLVHVPVVFRLPKQ